MTTQQEHRGSGDNVINKIVNIYKNSNPKKLTIGIALLIGITSLGFYILFQLIHCEPKLEESNFSKNCFDEEGKLLFSVSVQYPVLELCNNKNQLQQTINTKLREFSFHHLKDSELFFKDCDSVIHIYPHFALDHYYYASYENIFINDELLVVKFFVEDREGGGVKPFITESALNIDLNTGKTITYANIFSNNRFRNLINSRLEFEFSTKYGLSVDEFQLDLLDLDFYVDVGRQSIVFLIPVGTYYHVGVMQNAHIEIPIKFEELKDVIDYNGAIASLVS